MTRTQIQLPDEVYDRARKVCETRENSFAELARRGLEYILSVYAAPPGGSGDWEPPKPRRLGWKNLSDAQIKEQARLTATEAALANRRKRWTERPAPSGRHALDGDGGEQVRKHCCGRIVASG